MKIAIVVIANGDFAVKYIGARILSSVLKEKGYSVNLYFPFYTEDSYYDLLNSVNEEKFKELKDRLSVYDVVLISIFNSHLIWQAYSLKEFIKDKNKLILFGGPHCIAAPDSAIIHNDIICSSEAEICLINFLNKYITSGGDVPTDIPGMWVNKEGKLYKNGVPELVSDLDTLPYPDYNFKDNWIWKHNRFQEIDKDIPHFNDEITQISISLTRGCAFKCSFCLQSNLAKEGFRKHSIDYTMKQLKYFKTVFPNLLQITFSDSDFLLLPESYLSEFIDMYKKEIKIRFNFNSNPIVMKRRKIEIIFDSGLVHSAWIGVQGASNKINKYFNREYQKNEQIIDTSAFLKKYYKKYFTVPTYYFIYNTPVEDTSDYIENVKLISRMSKPSRIRNLSLMILPGTKLFERELTEEQKKRFNTKDFKSINEYYSNQESYTVKGEEAQYFAKLCKICSKMYLPPIIIDSLINNKNYFIVKYLGKASGYYYRIRHKVIKTYYLIIFKEDIKVSKI